MPFSSASNVMPSTKAQVPIYPRPVSPIHAEPTPVYADDQVYESSDGDGISEAERVAKRQRIEKWGQRYLRGENVFILSAGLKGPFEGNAWKKPWRGPSRPQSKAGAVLEVPETTERGHVASRKRPAHGLLDPSADHDGKQAASNLSCESREHAVSTKQVENWLEAWNVQKEKNDEASLPSGATRPAPWLKRNDAYCTNVDKNRAQSPTPVGITENRLEIPGTGIKRSRRHSNKKIPSIPVNKTTPKPGERRFSGRTAQAVRGTRRTTGPAAMNDPHLDKPDAQSDQDSGTEPLRFALQVKDENLALQAENATMKAKRKSLQILPSSDNLPAFKYRRVADQDEPHGNLPRQKPDPRAAEAPQDREATFPEIKAGKKRPVDSRQPRRDQEAPLMVNHPESPHGYQPKVLAPNPQSPLNPPNLSEDTSATSVTNLLPSAQFNPAQPQQASVLIHSNGDKMLEEPTPIATPEDIFAQVVLERVPVQAPPGPPIQQEHHPTRHFRSQQGDPDEKKTPTLPPPAATLLLPQATDLDTQEVLSVMTPLGFSTVKKVAPQPARIQSSSTPTATKGIHRRQENLRAKKSTKRTSFAPDALSASLGSSQGSILTSLKVSKRSGTVDKGTKESHRSPEPPMFGKLGLDMETSNEDENNGNDVRRGQISRKYDASSESLSGFSPTLVKTSTRPLKSALKSSAPATVSSSVQTLNPFLLAQTSTSRNSVLPGGSTTSGLYQDAQPQAHLSPFDAIIQEGQNGSDAREGKRDEDAGFDLKSAIDDLGSYLGTWNAEKEASSLAAID